MTSIISRTPAVWPKVIILRLDWVIVKVANESEQRNERERAREIEVRWDDTKLEGHSRLKLH